MNIFDDDAPMTQDASSRTTAGAGNEMTVPGRAASASDRPLRAAAPPPGPPKTSARWVETDRVGSATVLTVREPHLREAHASELTPELIATARLTGGRLVLDLAAVRAFCCAWINLMIRADEECRKFGGRLSLLNLAPELQTLLRSTGLHERLHIAASAREALEGPAATKSAGLSRWLRLGGQNAA
mgnify:CR=1 FL=1